MTFLNECILIPNDKMLHYPASMNVTGVGGGRGVNTVDDELRCVVEVHFSVLSYLN